MTASMDAATATVTTTGTLGNKTNKDINKDKRKGGARPGSGRPRTRPHKVATMNKDVKKIVFQNEIVQAAVHLSALRRPRVDAAEAGAGADVDAHIDQDNNGVEVDVDIDDSRQLESLSRNSKHNLSGQEMEYECQFESSAFGNDNDRDDTEERLQLSSAAYNYDDNGDDEREPSQAQLAKRVSFESIESTGTGGTDTVEKENVVEDAEEVAAATTTGPKVRSTPTSSVTIISSLHPNDILIGHNDWPGTRRYHAWVDARKKHFHLSSKRSERARLAKEVTALVQSQNPPGRFLRFIKPQGWFAIDETTVLTELGKDFRQGITGGTSMALPARPPPPPPPQHMARGPLDHQLIPPASLPSGPRFPAASYLPTMPQRAPFRGPPPPPHLNPMAPPPHRHAKAHSQLPAFYPHVPTGMRTTGTDGSRARALTPPAGTRGYPHAQMHGRAGAGAGLLENKDPRYSQYAELSRHSRRVSTDGSPSTTGSNSGKSFSEHSKILDNTTSKTLLQKPRLSTKRSTSDDRASVSSTSSSSSTTSLPPSVKNEEPTSKKVRRPHSFWGPKEDEELRRAVEKNGEKWSAVALDMPACSSEQCRYRWTHCLNPEINRDPLTADEYRAILEHQAKVGNKWSKLAKELSGRYVQIQSYARLYYSQPRRCMLINSLLTH